jgi:hypothetical protein
LPQLISGQHQSDDQQLQQENGLKLQGCGLDSVFASMRINTEIIDQCATPDFPLALDWDRKKRCVGSRLVHVNLLRRGLTRASPLWIYKGKWTSTRTQHHSQHLPTTYHSNHLRRPTTTHHAISNTPHPPRARLPRCRRPRRML